jgi:hypothetical protein
MFAVTDGEGGFYVDAERSKAVCELCVETMGVERQQFAWPG